MTPLLRTPTPKLARQLRSSLARPSKRRKLSTPSLATPPYRVLLFGADEFSCATLQALHEARHGLIEELTVVTPPDARTGRGLKTVHIPPLRRLAEELEVPSIALPQTLLKGWEPPAPFTKPSPSHLLLTASFGHLIPTSLLSLFSPLNALNVHPSLLPRYRGAAPIQWAIANGDLRTGVSVQELSRGKFDQGRLLGQRHVELPPNSDFGSACPLLAREGGELLVKLLRNLSMAQAAAQPQDPAAATLAPKLVKDTSRIDWKSHSATELLQRQRGFRHQFPLWTTIASEDGTTLKVYQIQLEGTESSTSSAVENGRPSSHAPGTLAMDVKTRSLYVKCGGGCSVAVIEKIKAPGGKWVLGREWWNGSGKAARGLDGTIQLE